MNKEECFYFLSESIIQTRPSWQDWFHQLFPRENNYYVNEHEKEELRYDYETEKAYSKFELSFESFFHVNMYMEKWKRNCFYDYYDEKKKGSFLK